MKLRLGTRGSLLARTQSGHVADALRRFGHEVELVFIKTEGDIRLDVPLADIGGKGLFLKELEEALLDDRVDFAVHSLKDVPGELAPGLVLCAYPQRQDVRDAWISRDGSRFSEAPAGLRVGTGSLRRQALLKDLRPDLEPVPIRGNVDTRLRKLADGDVDAILLASAGLRRLDRIDEATELLDPGQFPPAAGQGILGLECRPERDDVVSALAQLNDPEAEEAARAERHVLARLGGDCRTPLAAWARREAGLLKLDAFYAPTDGTPSRRAAGVANDGESIEDLADRVSDELLQSS